MSETDPKIYKFFSDLIFKETGIVYSESDSYRLDARFMNLCRKFDCENTEKLYDLYRINPTQQMMRELIDLSTNNETYFFRDNKPFDALTNDLIPELQKVYAGETIKIWSCACSTGQEPYSIAMSLIEKFGDTGIDFEIWATDISEDALAKARAGIYSGLDVQRGLPIQLLVKYFEQADNENWKVKDNLKSKVTFSPFNLLDGVFPLNGYHIIFCRNVLIYQNVENKETIISKVSDSLKPGGSMIFGSGESLLGIKNNLEQDNLSGQLVFKKALKSDQAA